MQQVEWTWKLVGREDAWVRELVQVLVVELEQGELQAQIRGPAKVGGTCSMMHTVLAFLKVCLLG